MHVILQDFVFKIKAKSHVTSVHINQLNLLKMISMRQLNTLAKFKTTHSDGFNQNNQHAAEIPEIISPPKIQNYKIYTISHRKPRYFPITQNNNQKFLVLFRDNE
jgi:hypothetical protein